MISKLVIDSIAVVDGAASEAVLALPWVSAAPTAVGAATPSTAAALSAVEVVVEVAVNAATSATSPFAFHVSSRFPPLFATV